MKASSNPSLRIIAVCAVVLACDRTTAPAPEPHVLPPPTPNASGATTYLAARTIQRTGTAAQSVNIALDEHEHSQFMEPFVLHVQQAGGHALAATIRVDGLPVLEPRDFGVMGTDSYSLEISVTPTSVIRVELAGAAGGSLTLRVDAPVQPAPVITITSPSRHSASSGAFLEQGTFDPSTVQITGTACHTRFPITELEIAGNTVTVPGTNLCESFSVAQQSRWGMSIITGRARNARGREGTVVQAYTRGPDHYPAAFGDSAVVRGLFNHVSQAGLDDGSRVDPDDLATLIANAFNALAVGIPASIPFACNDVFEVRIPAQTPVRSIAINSLTATATHVAIDVTMQNPSIVIEVRADANPFDGDCVGTLVENGQFSATSIRVTAELRAAASPPNLPPRVTVSLHNPQVTVTGATASATSGAATALVSGLTSVAASLITSFFGDLIFDALSPQMSNLLNSFIPPISSELQLNGATLSIATGLSAVQHGAAFLRLGAFGRIQPVTTLAGAVAPRGPVRALCGSTAMPCPNNQVPMPPFTAAQPLSVAVHQDMVNHALWSAWRAGAFKLTAPSVSLDATMPPVSMAMAAGDPMGEIRWGDVRVTATFDPVELGLPAGAPVVVESWASATVRGNVEFSANSRALVLSDVTTTIDVQLISPLLPVGDAAVRSAIADRLSGPLITFTTSGLAVFPIPDSEPRLVNATVTRNGFFYILAGALQ